jgi:hypothetical protein
MKRTWWLVALAIVAAFVLYLSFAGQPAKSQPQVQDEFPSEQEPPAT